MRDKRVYATVAAIAALGVLLGSFLPWVRFTGPFGEFTKRGLEDGSEEGIITLVLGLIAVWAVAYYLFGQGRGLIRSLLLTVVGAAIISVASLDMVDRDRAVGVLKDFQALVAAGLEPPPTAFVAAEGLYLTLIGGIGIFLMGLAGTLLPARIAPALAEHPVEVSPVTPVPGREGETTPGDG